MFIALAYPYEGHVPDEVIEVDEATGRRLLRAGRARRADPPSKPAPRRRTKPTPELETRADQTAPDEGDDIEEDTDDGR